MGIGERTPKNWILCLELDGSVLDYAGFVRFLFLFSRALWCLLAFALPLSAAEAEPTVVVLRGSELEWQEASLVLEAELHATGFSVETRTTSASTPGQLIDELRAAGSGGVRGAVAVFRGQSGPRAYVWLPGRDDLVQLEAPFDAANVAHEVLALRIVELLRTRWAPVPRPAPPPRVAPAPEPKAVRSVAWLALGPAFSLSTGQGPVQFAAGGNLRLFPHGLLELSGATSLMADEPRSDLGTIEVRRTQLSLHPLFEFEPSESLDAAIGPGVGAVFLAARGLAESPSVSGLESNPLLFQSSLRARASLRSGPLAAMLMAEFSWLFSRVTFQAGDEQVLKYSGAAVFVAGGLAWAH